MSLWFARYHHLHNFCKSWLLCVCVCVCVIPVVHSFVSCLCVMVTPGHPICQHTTWHPAMGSIQTKTCVCVCLCVLYYLSGCVQERVAAGRIHKDGLSVSHTPSLSLSLPLSLTVSLSLSPPLFQCLPLPLPLPLSLSLLPPSHSQDQQSGMAPQGAYDLHHLSNHVIICLCVCACVCVCVRAYTRVHTCA